MSSTTLTRLLHHLYKTPLPSIVTCPRRLPVKPSLLLVGESLAFLLVAFTSQAGKSEIYPMVLPHLHAGIWGVFIVLEVFTLRLDRSSEIGVAILLFALLVYMQAFFMPRHSLRLPVLPGICHNPHA